MRKGPSSPGTCGGELVKEESTKEIGMDRKIEGKLGECAFPEAKKVEHLKEKGASYIEHCWEVE